MAKRKRLEVVIPTRLSKADASSVRRLAVQRHITPAAWVRIIVLEALARLKAAPHE